MKKVFHYSFKHFAIMIIIVEFTCISCLLISKFITLKGMQVFNNSFLKPETSEGVMIPLQEKLNTRLSQLDGEWSLYLENLETGEVIEINSHMQKSASLIKLFVAGCYEEKIELNQLEETYDSEQEEKAMLTWSDNNAWVQLESTIGNGSYRNGYEAVNQFARDYGYVDSGRCMEKDGSWNGTGGMNWTSVHDVGTCLHRIYQGTYVTKNASKKILECLDNQAIRTKIPAGLPDGIECANKTGELGNTENDAAIIYGEKVNYILVIMSDGIESSKARREIVSLSKEIYEEIEK